MLTYDLHTHSTASDGTLTPTELVAYARECGTDVLAITDHDITEGLAEAETVAREFDITVIPGIEISITWGHQTLHMLGLHIDPDNRELQAGIAKLQDFRVTRAEKIAFRLEKAGIPGALDAAKRLAKGNILSRTHFAHFLVEAGHAKDVRQVFKRFLVHNKPGFVAGEWADLGAAIQWVREAGGLAVLAHPARYKLSATKMRQMLAEFSDYGGVGIEVVSSSHSVSDIQRFTQVADDFGFYASRGSDYHGQHTAYADPKRLPDLPDKCRPIWTHPDWHTTPLQN